MRLKFEVGADGAVNARWLTDSSWDGYRGIIHGGIVCTVLDEAMAKAVAALSRNVPTAEMRVRFRRPIESGQEFGIRGWIVERANRRILTESAVTGQDGEEFAHGWGTFLPLATQK